MEAAPVLAYSDNDALGAPTRPGCAGKPQPGSVPCSGSEQAWGHVRCANKRNGFFARATRRESTGMGGSVDRAVELLPTRSYAGSGWCDGVLPPAMVHVHVT